MIVQMNNSNPNLLDATGTHERPPLERMDTVFSDNGEGYDVLPLPSPATEGTELPLIPGYKARIPYMSIYGSPSRLMVGLGISFLPKTQVIVKVTSAERSVSYRHPFNPYLYTLHITHGDFQWTLYKRYHHFLELHEKLWAYRASLRIPLPTKTHINRRKTGKAHSGGNTKSSDRSNHTIDSIPHFPKRPDIWVSPEMIDKRLAQLEQYINTMLQSPIFRNHSSTKKFLEVSQFSFIEDLGEKGKEGVIRKRSGGHRIRIAFLERMIGVRPANMFAIWSSRWFVVKDTFLMYLDPHIHKAKGVKGVMLFDRSLTIEVLKKKERLMITNGSRRLLVNCWTDRQASVWMKEIEETIANVCPEITDKNIRHKSFAPIRMEYAHWFVDGREYMNSVADAIDNASEEIFITDWWLSPEIYLKRPLVHGEYWRLDKVLKRKADEGVKIYVLLYKEVEMAISLDSAYTKRTLQELNPTNIRVLRHPDHVAADTLLWAHHEKILVVDQIVGFVGGIDLCYGRWDDHSHRLTDIGAISEDHMDGATVLDEDTSRYMNQPKSAMTSAIGMMAISPMAIVEQVANKEVARSSPNEKAAKSESGDDEEDKSNGEVLDTSNNEENSKNKVDGDTNSVKEKNVFTTAYKEMSEAVRLQVQSKYWVGKDYNNFVLKDLTNLDEPYDDMINRKTDPRMPWHDIACVTYGKAARDVARHFIQRWNFTKLQKAKNGKDVTFLLPKSYNAKTLQLNKDRIHPDAIKAQVQILRSSSEWSAGITETEHSIQNAYMEAINNSEHYIYIENQFFISVRNEPQIHNRIVEALYQRILRAHNDGAIFRVFVVMPLIPGFEGDISDSSKSQAIQAVLDWQYKSINRGPGSLIGGLEKEIGGRWTNYVTFCGLRTHSELGGKPITEIIYVHSKMLIVDDKLAIIGSANINDRSMTGVRDSEVAMLIEDTEMIDSTMSGKSYKVGKSVSALRKRCFAEHLGSLPEDYNEESYFTPTIKMDDITCDEFYKSVWMKTAGVNSTVYEKVFCCVPCDYVKDFTHIEKYQSKKMTDVTKMREELTKIRGNLVLLPLQFLSSAKLAPDAITKEGMAPTDLWT